MTIFQKRLKSYVWGYKAVERHWFLKEGAPRLVVAPSTGEQITIKRALYAAFRGDLPEGFDLRPECNISGCVAPDHQKLESSRSRTARALHLPDLDKVGLDERSNRLPKGLTLALVAQVKELGNSGSSLQSISAATQLNRSLVMKIRGGVYDRAVASLRRGLASSRKLREQNKSASVEAAAQPSETPQEPEPDDAEVVAWMRSMQ